MKLKSFTDKEKHSVLRNVLTGLVISLVVSVILAILFTVFIFNGQVDDDKMNIFTLVITFVASSIGAIVSGKLNNGKYALVTMLTGVIYLLSLIVTGVMFFDGGLVNIWMCSAVIISGALGACVICVIGQGGRRKTKKHIR